MAKPLFLCKQARQGIQTAITFLSTRVKEPDEDDWKKLKRVLLHLNGTIDLITMMCADKLNVAKWWVDGSYATHPTIRGHTGATMSVGKGSVFS
eukprot:4694314-Ditylum_brightwellii.AAC.1